MAVIITIMEAQGQLTVFWICRGGVERDLKRKNVRNFICMYTTYIVQVLKLIILYSDDRDIRH